jgi:hypothetical protein
MSSKSKSTSSDTSGGKEAWYKTAPWGLIIKYLVIGLMLMGVISAVTKFFTSKGPIPDGINKVLGGLTRFLDAFDSGCSPQSDCSKPDNEDTCDSSTGCGWNTPDKGGDKATCINTTGNKAGSGGFVNIDCGLFWLSLGIFSIIALRIGKFIASFFVKRNENVKNASSISGESVDKVEADVAKTAKDNAGETVDNIREKTKEEPSKDVKELAGKSSASASAEGRVQKSVDGQSGVDPQKQQQQKADAAAQAAEENKQSEEDATNEGVKDPSDVTDEANDVAVKNGTLDPVTATISGYSKHNIIPSKLASHYLLRRANRSNTTFQDHHIQYLNKIKNIHQL